MPPKFYRFWPPGNLFPLLAARGHTPKCLQGANSTFTGEVVCPPRDSQCHLKREPCPLLKG